MVVIRPCRLGECPAVLALWERAGAIPSPTDTIEELRRLVRESGDSFLVAVHEGAVVAPGEEHVQERFVQVGT